MLDFVQMLDAACHWPPFFSQSAFVLYCDISLDDPLPIEGLADGDVADDPLDEPELPEVPELPPMLPFPVLPFSELPDVPPGLLPVP